MQSHLNSEGSWHLRGRRTLHEVGAVAVGTKQDAETLCISRHNKEHCELFQARAVVPPTKVVVPVRVISFCIEYLMKARRASTPWLERTSDT